MAASSDSPNLFLLLELDTAQAWDQAEFDRRLQQKRQEWSRLVNVPNEKGMQAKRNLGHIPELERIAKDKTLREAQAETARAVQERDNAELLRRLDEELGVLQAKGWVSEEEIQDLAAKYAKVAALADIRKRVTEPVRNEAPTEGGAKREALDPSSAKMIQDKLKAMGKADLYDFLGIGLSAETQVSVLIAQANKRYTQVQRKGSKTQEDTITAELAGYCLGIFKSDEDKARYDETIRQQKFIEFAGMLDMAASKTKQVAERQIQHILKKARQKNLNPSEVLAVLVAYAQRRGYTLIVPSQETLENVKRLPRCQYCGKLSVNDATQSHCTNCGKPLVEDCPRCTQPVASDFQACGKCGFPIGNRAWVEQLLIEAANAIKLKDHEHAAELLEQAALAWQDAKSGKVRQTMDDLLAKNNAATNLRDDLLKRLRNAAAERHFYRANELSDQVAVLLAPGHAELAALRKAAQDAIGLAEASVQKARRLSAEAAAQVYTEALGYCIDCAEARKGLAEIPPAPPDKLNPQLSGGAVHLSWHASPSSSVSYHILRKSKIRPTSPQDGKVLGNTRGAVFDDTDPEVGLPLYYAVYAERGGVYSTVAATHDNPQLQVAEVSELKVEPGDGKVIFYWKPPPHVIKVWLTRSETHFPKESEDGVARNVTPLSTFSDENLTNGTRYYYTMFCFFDSGGLSGYKSSTGVRCEATPQAPPQPISDLTIESQAIPGTVRLTWTTPPVGEALLLRSPTPFPWRLGEIVPSRDLSTATSIALAGPDHALDQLGHYGCFHYLPVVLLNGMAYIGKAQKHFYFEGITRLEIRLQDYALRLRWRWPAQCEEAEVSYYCHWEGQTGQPKKTVFIVTKAQYETRGGYCDIPEKLIEAAYDITVSGLLRYNGESIKTQPCQCHWQARKAINLRYQIKQTGWFSRLIGGGPRFSLRIDIQGDGEVPAIVLVVKQGGLPVGKEDGEAHELEPIAAGKSSVRIDLPVYIGGMDSYAKLYLKDDKDYDFVRIDVPHPDDLRLFA